MDLPTPPWATRSLTPPARPSWLIASAASWPNCSGQLGIGFLASKVGSFQVVKCSLICWPMLLPSKICITLKRKQGIRVDMESQTSEITHADCCVNPCVVDTVYTMTLTHTC